MIRLWREILVWGWREHLGLGPDLLSFLEEAVEHLISETWDPGDEVLLLQQCLFRDILPLPAVAVLIVLPRL